MRIVAVTTPVGAPVMQFQVAHGEHPDETLSTRGLVPVRPLSAVLVDEEIQITFLVREGRATRRPRRRPFLHEEPDSTEVPAIRQRPGAYAIVASARGILGTVNSTLTGSPGTWALPGGGIDPGESPSNAVAREVFEETGQLVTLHRLLAVDSDHWIGRSTTGVLEDFHALRVIYAAVCASPTDPVVLDAGGSTQSASWVEPSKWRSMHWTISSRSLLNRYARQTMALVNS